MHLYNITRDCSGAVFREFQPPALDVQGVLVAQDGTKAAGIVARGILGRWQRGDGVADCSQMVGVPIVFGAAIVGGAVWTGRRPALMPAVFICPVVPYLVRNLRLPGSLELGSLETFPVTGGVGRYLATNGWLTLQAFAISWSDH